MPVCADIVSSGVDNQSRGVVSFLVVVHSDLETLLDRFSPLCMIQAIVAWCLRFGHSYRHQDRIIGPLTEVKLHRALPFIVGMVQSKVFRRDISKLWAGLSCSKPVHRLSPFLDSEGILCVGVRLSKSDLPFDTRHPTLLHRVHRLSELLILQIHRKHDAS